MAHTVSVIVPAPRLGEEKSDVMFQRRKNLTFRGGKN
jgi:hypothetical protein